MARDCFKAALEIDPSNIVIQSNITVCTFYMGMLKEVCNISSSKDLIGTTGNKIGMCEVMH